MNPPEVEPCTWTLITIRCEDGLDLDALWVSPPSPIAAVVHVHGRGGNFYHNAFLRKAYEEYPRHGIAVLGLNTRGNGGIVEAYREHRVTYVGSAFERLDESILDIHAAVAFVRGLVERVILQGHSYGCDKVVYYGRIHVGQDLVLISPANSVRLQQAYTEGEPIGIEQPSSSDGWGLAPKGSYGIRAGDRSYPVPIHVGTLMSMMDGIDLSIFDHTRDPLFEVNNRALVLLGEADVLQLGDLDRMESFCEAMMPNARIVRHSGADHHFSGFEAGLCSTIAGWIGEGSLENAPTLESKRGDAEGPV